MANFYLVGGAVRDKLRGIDKPKDMDFTVEAESFDAMREAIVARGATIFLEQEQFLTIRAKMPFAGVPVDADFVLARKESDSDYDDGRRPNQVVAGTLADDLARRDFTMNAIAMDEDGNIIDPFDGQKAIKYGLIHAVGDARDRFAADRLRKLRALRFSVTLGFTTDLGIYNALKADPSLTGVSAERIREEVDKMMRADRFKTIDLLFRTFPLIGTEVMESIGFQPTTQSSYTKYIP